MANRLGGMPLAPEMNPFEAEIGSHQQLVTRGGLENGAIVSDTSDHALSSGGAFADAHDQQLFGEWQDEVNIKEAMPNRRKPMRKNQSGV